MAIQKATQVITVEIITVAWMRTNLMGGYPYIGPAFDTAIADVAQAYPRLNLTHSLVFDDSFDECREWAMESDNRLAELYYRTRQSYGAGFSNLTVFLLAGCYDLTGVIQFGTGLNKLVISTATAQTAITDKPHFPTYFAFNYVSGNLIRLTYRRLLNLYRWSTVFIILDVASQSGFAIIARGTQTDLLGAGITVNFEARNVSSSTEMAPVFQRLNETSRVVLLFADTSATHSFLIQVIQRNFTDGSFVFIPYYALPVYGKGAESSDSLAPSRNEDIRKALRVCLLLELDPRIRHVSADYASKWKELSRTKYNYKYGPDEQVAPTVSSTYAATAVLGQVVNQIADTVPDFNWTNGAELATHFFNRTFTTNVGPITLNSFGERLTMITLSYFNEKASEFQTVLKQDVDLGKDVEIIATPDWPGPWPVPNEPKCGFRGDRGECQLNGTKFLLISGLAGSLAVSVCVTFVFFGARYVLRRQDFYGDWWILDFNFVGFIRVNGHSSPRALNAAMSRYR